MSICLESSRTTPAAPSIGLSVIAALPQTLRVAFYGLTSPTGCATGAPQECTDEPPEPTSVSTLPSLLASRLTPPTAIIRRIKIRFRNLVACLSK